MLTRPGPATYNPPGAPSSAAAASIDPNIGSTSELAALPTTGVLFAGAIRMWINSDTGALETWRLLVGTDASGPGIQRPFDYNASAPLCWYKAGS